MVVVEDHNSILINIRWFVSFLQDIGSERVSAAIGVENYKLYIILLKYTSNSSPITDSTCYKCKILGNGSIILYITNRLIIVQFLAKKQTFFSINKNKMNNILLSSFQQH